MRSPHKFIVLFLLYPFFSSAHQLIDFNGDGKEDYIYRDTENLEWRIDISDGVDVANSFSLDGLSSCCGWLFNGVGDFNADGYTDVIIRNIKSGKWYIYNIQNNEILSKGYVPIEDATTVGVQSVADFNRDGYSDVLLRNEKSGSWSIVLLNNRQIIQNHTPPMSKVLSWEIIDAKDFDGNGSPDILIRNKVSGSWYIYLYEKTNIVNRGYIKEILPHSLDEEFQATGDFNGDNRADILFRNLKDNSWHIVLMDGRRPIDIIPLKLSESGAWRLNAVGDFNGDGTSDISLVEKTSKKTFITLMHNGDIKKQDFSNVVLSKHLASASLKKQSSPAELNTSVKFSVLPSFAPSPPPKGYFLDETDALRLLVQTTFGPDPDSLRELMSMGADYWFERQVEVIEPSWLTLIQNELTKDPSSPSTANVFWKKVVTQEDQLRSRVTYALSQLMVVSTASNLNGHFLGSHSYLDVLHRNAFGNFRQLLSEVTTHATMGFYLNMLGNQKADIEKNIRPDENFAREVMQLFTIGVSELNQDGTAKKSVEGEVIETYTPETIKEYAKVYTGWHLDVTTEDTWDTILGIFPPLDAYSVIPMKPIEKYHQKTRKVLLNGFIVPSGQSAREDLEIALDSLFYHPNVAPFISKFLIQKLVTSNPSPDYVRRVASVFNNNGDGTRGDMKSVIKAIIFDNDARTPVNSQDKFFGKIREPILKSAHLFKLFNYSSSEEDVTFPSQNYNQFILQSPTVFNFFRPDYSPVGIVRDSQLLAPEMQIINEASIVNLNNFIGWPFFFGTGETYSKEVRRLTDVNEGQYDSYYDLESEVTIFKDGGRKALFEHLNMFMLENRASDELMLALDEYFNDHFIGLENGDINTVIIPTTNPIPTDELDENAVIEFVIGQLIYLIYSSPEFHVQR